LVRAGSCRFESMTALSSLAFLAFPLALRPSSTLARTGSPIHDRAGAALRGARADAWHRRVVRIGVHQLSLAHSEDEVVRVFTDGIAGEMSIGAVRVSESIAVTQLAHLLDERTCDARDEELFGVHVGGLSVHAPAGSSFQAHERAVLSALASATSAALARARERAPHVAFVP
jgi:hypothetical protein